MLEDLGAGLAALENPAAAIVAVSGAIEERLVLPSAQLRDFGTPYDVETGEPNLQAEGPLDLSIKYSGGQAALSLVLSDTSVGVPQTDNMRFFSVGSKSWFAHAGDCTLELVDFDWIVLGELLFPAFAGVASCENVTELRTD